MEPIVISGGDFYLTTDPDQVAQTISAAWAWYNYPLVRKKLIHDGFSRGRGEFNDMWVKMTARFPACLVFSIQRESDKPIGIISYDEGALNIVIDPDEWGKGYGVGALALLIDSLFAQTQVSRVYATYPKKNKHANKIFREKLGFHQDGMLREALSFRGEPENVIVVSLLKREWQPLLIVANGAVEGDFVEPASPPEEPEEEKQMIVDEPIEEEKPAEEKVEALAEDAGLYDEIKKDRNQKVVPEPAVGTEVDIENAPLVLDGEVVYQPPPTGPIK